MRVGGDTLYLNVANSGAPPLSILMTDNLDGTYTADYTISGGAGAVSLSISGSQSSPGLLAEYFSNSSWSGTP